jgi:hypothetical protein
LHVDCNAQAASDGNVVKDLLSLEDDGTPRAGGAANPSQSFADDLLGLSAPVQGGGSGGAGAAPAPSNAAADLLSLLDGPAPSQAPAASASSAPQQDPLVRAFGRVDSADNPGQEAL